MNEKSEFNMGEKIKKFRKEAKMTQKELAEKLHVTDKAISKWETNKGFPDMATIPLLAKVFEVSPSSFFDDTSEIEKTTLIDERAEEMVSTTIQYAKGVENIKTQSFRSKFFSFIFFLSVMGAIICLLIDWLLNRNITWARFPMTSILFFLCLIAPLFLAKDKRGIKFLGIFSLGILPFLWVIEQGTNVSWFLPIALPISVTVIFLLWLIYFLFQLPIKRTKLYPLLVLTVPFIDFVVDRTLAVSFIDHYRNPWQILWILIATIGLFMLVLFTNKSLKK